MQIKPTDPLLTQAVQPRTQLPAASTPRVAEETPVPQADGVTLSGAPPVETPAAAEEARKPSPAASEPPPVTLMETEPPPAQEKLDEPMWLLEAVKGSPLEDSPALGGIRSRMAQASPEMRSAAALALLDAVTSPSVKEGNERLDDLSSALGWAQKHKKEARAILAEGGGYDAVLEKAREADKASSEPATALDAVLASPGLFKESRLSDRQVTEANNLLEQFQAGNKSPGIGSSTLGKGVMYLRGREGTRIFYRMEQNKPQWLAVVNKSDENAAIRQLRDAFDLR